MTQTEKIHRLFEQIWQDFRTRLCPSAEGVQALFSGNDGRKNVLRNDHIALRTFDLSAINLNAMASVFCGLGFEEKDAYFFPQKRLVARYFEHPDAQFPKIFISELTLAECSTTLQSIVKRMVGDYSFTGETFYLGRPWRLRYSDYQTLLEESEYAAWVAAHGFGANHFTLDANIMRQFTSLEEVNSHLESAGYELNSMGGKIKGSAAVFLEQSSTMADEVIVKFDEGNFPILGGFYEFALRHRLPNGAYYQGFVEASADKIFQSTNRRNE